MGAEKDGQSNWVSVGFHNKDCQSEAGQKCPKSPVRDDKNENLLVLMKIYNPITFVKESVMFMDIFVFV